MDTTDLKTYENFWFVLRVTYQHELAAKAKLDSMGIENFIPMRRVRRRGHLGRFIWEEVPAIHNYIFIHTTRETLDSLKREIIPSLRYVMAYDSVKGKQPQIVPNREMESFIAVAGNTTEQIQYLGPEEVNLKEGDKVRVLGGPFAGVEGTFLRIAGNRGKSVVISIPGVVVVSTTTIAAKLVEKK